MIANWMMDTAVKIAVVEVPFDEQYTFETVVQKVLGEHTSEAELQEGYYRRLAVDSYLFGLVFVEIALCGPSCIHSSDIAMHKKQEFLCV